MGELATEKRTIAQKDEEMRQMEERLQRLEAAYDRSQRRRRYHPMHESRSYQNYGSHEEEDGWRMHHVDDRRQNVAKRSLPFVKIPSFSGDGDPNIYLGWEAKVEQIFNVHEVQDDQKVKSVMQIKSTRRCPRILIYTMRSHLKVETSQRENRTRTRAPKVLHASLLNV